MKKVWLTILVGAALFVLSPEAHAQSVLKINILSPIVKTFNISYEHVLSDNSSFQLGFFYTGYKDDFTKFSGFGITPEYRFYLSDSPAPEGVYVAPFLRYQNFKLEDETFNDKADFSAFGGGLVIGKQWIFKDKISLEIFLGPAYYSGKVSGESGDTNWDTGAFDGFGLRTGINFGIKF
jgi:hypothetical protein